MNGLEWTVAQIALGVAALGLFAAGFFTQDLWLSLAGWVVLIGSWVCRSLGRRADREELLRRWQS